MFIGLHQCYYKKGDFNPKMIEDFFRKYPFVPYREVVSGYDEDANNIYVSFDPYEIKHSLKLANLDDMPITRNIWCFDKKTGERLWAIDDYPTPKGANPIGPYGGAGFNTEGKLCASGKNVRYEIDINTGKISNPVFTK